MIQLESTIISDEIRDVYFCCDLAKCKGACCIEGDAGAPLEEEEISLLEDYIDDIKPFMVDEGIREVELMGIFDYDAEGKFVTPLVNGGACVFVYRDDGIARCAIEKAFQEKKIPFAKPISCHLYPIRIKQTPVNDLLNYHKWPICQKALEKGHNEKIPLYSFLSGALIRKYGRTWYNKLVKLLH
jgi:Fe-S-cluster containining protein